MIILQNLCNISKKKVGMRLSFCTDKLVVVVISADAYPFLAFSDLTCHLEDTIIGVSGCTVPPDSKETKLGSSDQEASPSAGKNTGVVLVPCSCMEVHPYSHFWWFGYF